MTTSPRKPVPAVPERDKTYALSPTAPFKDRSYLGTLWRVLDVNATHVLVIFDSGRRWAVGPERPHLLLRADYHFTAVTPEFRQTALAADPLASLHPIDLPPYAHFDQMPSAPETDRLVRLAWHSLQVSEQGLMVEGSTSDEHGGLMNYTVSTSDPGKAAALRAFVAGLEAKADDAPTFTGLQFHQARLAEAMMRDRLPTGRELE